jgi:L-malate glycosyltransferase
LFVKILILSTMGGDGWGGSEDLWEATARLALAEGHEVMVVTRRRDPEPLQIRELRSSGAQTLTFSPRRQSRRVRLFERMVHPLPSIVRWRPDVTLISQGTFFELAYRNDVNRWLQAIGKPYVIVVQHNTDLPLLWQDRTVVDRMHAYFGGAHCLAFVAERNLRSAERQMAAPLPNARIVRNPSKIEGRVPWPTGTEARLAAVGRLDLCDKGQDILLDVLGGEAWSDRPWRLSIFGSGRDRDYLERLSRSRGIEDRVVFRGFVGDIRSVWAEHHLLVMPSRSEGTPLVLVEAMLGGRPAVVTDVGDNFEWIDEPGNGFCAEAPTVRSFGAAMERAWSARESWESLGHTAERDARALIDPAPDRTFLGLLMDATRRGKAFAAGATGTGRDDRG